MAIAGVCRHALDGPENLTNLSLTSTGNSILLKSFDAAKLTTQGSTLTLTGTDGTTDTFGFTSDITQAAFTQQGADALVTFDGSPTTPPPDTNPPVTPPDTNPPVTPPDTNPPAPPTDTNPPVAPPDTSPPVAPPDTNPPDTNPPVAPPDTNPPVAPPDTNPPVTPPNNNQVQTVTNDLVTSLINQASVFLNQSPTFTGAAALSAKAVSTGLDIFTTFGDLAKTGQDLGQIASGLQQGTPTAALFAKLGTDLAHSAAGVIGLFGAGVGSSFATTLVDAGIGVGNATGNGINNVIGAANTYSAFIAAGDTPFDAVNATFQSIRTGSF